MMDRQPLLNFPATRRNRMHDGYAAVPFEHVENSHDTPSGTEKINSLCLFSVLQEKLLHMHVHEFLRQQAGVLKIDIDALHRDDIESGIREIAAKNIVDLATEIGCSNKAFHVQRMKRAD